MALPTSGFYNTVMQSYFGDLGASYQQQLWAAFLNNTGQTAPSETDPVTKAAFVKFASGVLARVDESIALIQLPPDEVAKRKILFDAFDAVLKMLGIVQDTIGAQAQLLIFYGNYQQEYTKMLTRVPLYTTSDPTTWQPNATDASKFTFGYNKISVQDISDYVASTGSTVNITNGNLSFSINSGSVTLSANGSPVYNRTIAPASDSTQDKSTATANAFLDTYNNNLSTINNSIAYSGNFALPPRFVQVPVPAPAGSNTTAQDAANASNDTISRNMGEVNARNQTFIDNITAQRQVIRDQASVVQSTLSESQQKISQISDLLTSFLSTFATLVRSITPS